MNYNDNNNTNNNYNNVIVEFNFCSFFYHAKLQQIKSKPSDHLFNPHAEKQLKQIIKQSEENQEIIRSELRNEEELIAKKSEEILVKV